MAYLDKVTDSKVANELSEPVIASLFKVQIIPHPSLGVAPIDILEQSITSVGGLDGFEKIPEVISQSIGGGATIDFPGIKLDQRIECNISVNLNLRGSDGTEATQLLVLKKMKDRQFNRASGARGLKKDCIFTVIIRRHTKDKKVWAVYTLDNCLFGSGGITGLDEVNIDTDDAAKLSFTVKSDKNKAEITSGF